MSKKLRDSIFEIDQFYSDGQVEPTHSACGAASSKSIHDYYYPDQKQILLDVIKLTPLVYFKNGTMVVGQQGLTCEQVMALCFRLGLDARLEFMTIDKLKSHLDADRPVICLIYDGDIPIYVNGVLTRQDRSPGYHFLVAVDWQRDVHNHDYFVMVDSDRVDPHSSFGQDVLYPSATLDKALADSDQTRLCIVVYGKLSVQIDHTATVVGGCNLRIQPSTDSYVQFALKQGDQVQVLKDGPVNASGHIWYRVQVKGMIGWVAREFLSDMTPVIPPQPVPKRILPIGPAYVTQAGDQLNVRSAPGILNASLGKLPALTPVMVLADDPLASGDRIWYKITSDKFTGWVAAEFLDTGVAPVFIPPAPKPIPVPQPTFNWKQHIGLHLMGSLDLVPDGYGLYKGMGYDGQDQVGRLQHLYTNNPNSVFIHRDYSAHNQWVNPEKFVADNGGVQNAVQVWIDNQMHYLQALPFAFHEGFNEAGMSDVHLAFEVERVRQLHARGFNACVLNIAGGTADTPDWQRAKSSGLLQILSETGIIGVHCYTQSMMSCATNGSYWDKNGNWQGDLFPSLVNHSPDGNYDAWLALRVIRYANDVTKLGFGKVRFAVTELGLDDCVQPGNGVNYPREGKQNGWKSCIPTWQRLGWLSVLSAPDFYLKQLQWWSTIINAYPQILGGTVYTYGTDDHTWDNFNTQGVL